MTRSLAALLACVCISSSALAAEPPGPPAAGYGSSDAYISAGWTVLEEGSARRGTRVWTFVPDVLRDGASAPVVVYLHGWTAYLPDFYLGHIEHLVKQGLVVVYPQYQKAGAVGLLTDSDQYMFLDRAIEGVEDALRTAGDVADRRQLYVAGHSLGGLLAYAWEGAGGPRAQGVLLLNASLTSDDVPDDVPLVPIDWQAYAQDITQPLLVLTGDLDGLSPDSTLGYEAAVNAQGMGVFMATTDRHGDPALVANHGAPLAVSGEAETLDARYYFYALDALVAGESGVSFDMGVWSDGVPVAEVQQLLP